MSAGAAMTVVSLFTMSSLAHQVHPPEAIGKIPNRDPATRMIMILNGNFFGSSTQDSV